MVRDSLSVADGIKCHRPRKASVFSLLVKEGCVNDGGFASWTRRGFLLRCCFSGPCFGIGYSMLNNWCLWNSGLKGSRQTAMPFRCVRNAALLLHGAWIFNVPMIWQLWESPRGANFVWKQICCLCISRVFRCFTRIDSLEKVTRYSTLFNFGTLVHVDGLVYWEDYVH